MAAQLTLQQQLNEMTEKYNALNQKTKHLELEQQEYATDLQNYRSKDLESELRIKELSKEKTETQRRQSVLYKETISNSEMLETEYASNQQLRLESQEHIATINQLNKENQRIKEINEKYEKQLKKVNQEMIKLEKENQNKSKQYQQQMSENIIFLMSEIQTLQTKLTHLTMTNNFDTEAEDEAVSAPLLSQDTVPLNPLPSPSFGVLETPIAALNFSDLNASDKTNMFAFNDTLRSILSNCEFGSRGNTVQWNDMNGDAAKSVDRFAPTQFMEAVDKQKMEYEYEILLQSLTDDNEELSKRVEMVNEEKKMLFESNMEYVERESSFNEQIKILKKQAQKQRKVVETKSFWSDVFKCNACVNDDAAFSGTFMRRP